MNTIRAFIAIELAQSILTQLSAVQSQCKAALPAGCVRWVRPGGIHLTLKFLGDVPTAQLDTIKAALAEAAGTSPTFSLEVGHLGCFPNLRRPSVVWVGIQEPGGALVRLQCAIESAVARLGYPSEKRPFSPHLTLGRVSRQARPGELRRLGEFVESAVIGRLGQMDVDEVVLIQSVLKPSGAEYTTLARASLGQLKAGM
ncbi:MAG: RNA 2',3'-cyclic phosphodiesterase [Thermoflexales bacterium]|nr:RNA 2',3'-cyclic phosphodiesterase [Thermoflexales bacterium]